MGKCSVCGKKIQYNQYKMYRGKVLCPECYDTRLERKAAKKAELKMKAEAVKIVTPSKKAKKAAKKKGVDLTALDERRSIVPKFYGGDDENENEDKAEDYS